jgi:hypothetical protein
MSATRIRYLLNQWRLRSLALSRLDDLSKDGREASSKPADPAPSRKPSPPEKGPATPE